MLPFLTPFTKGKEIHCFLSSGNTGASFTKGKGASMLPFFSSFSRGNTGASFTKGKELQCFLSCSPLAVETLEHPLPKERRFNASFLNSFSRGFLSYLL